MGGGPCIVIIQGAEGLAAVDRYVAQGPQGTPRAERESVVSTLRHQIEASCTLSYYLPLYEQHEGEDVPNGAFQPVIDFHERIAAHLSEMTVAEIEAAGEELKALNFWLAEKYGE